MGNATIFVASGEESQIAFDTLDRAIDAADKAPWADGRVFRHDCTLDEFFGFAEIGGEMVYCNIRRAYRE